MTILIKPQEAADMLKVSVPTIYRWAAAGVIPSIKIGGAVRLRKIDIDHMIGATPTADSTATHD